jgi:hypothetical protein
MTGESGGSVSVWYTVYVHNGLVSAYETTGGRASAWDNFSQTGGRASLLHTFLCAQQGWTERAP